MNLTFWFHNSARRSDPILWRSESILSFRRCNSLHDILVRAKHRRRAPKTTGAFRCNKSRWKTCPFITSYTFYSTNENGASHTTFPVHLPISFTRSSAINVTCNTSAKLNANSVTDLESNDDPYKKPETHINLIILPPFQTTSPFKIIPSRT